MENAIIMASGLGTRMRPLTEKTPKPLIPVRGKPMIETVIDALEARGVQKLFVVVGYLKEQFDYLKEKYKNVELVENPDFRTVNNISSVYYAARALELGACFICEADLYVAAPDEIFGRELKKSCYFGKRVDGYSDDWVFDLGDDGYITRVGKGGTDRYNMVGISYFDAADARRLSEKIAAAYAADGHETLFWDEVVDANLSALKLVVEPVSENAIAEIDTVDELNEINERI